jgi:hypothetical protein
MFVLDLILYFIDHYVKYGTIKIVVKGMKKQTS